MKRPVVLFLLDAMRHDYISENTTPFLFKYSRIGKYYERVIPSFGFCERTEILTGLRPKESGYFTAIGYDPNNSPFKSSILLNYLEVSEKLFQNIIIIFGKNKSQKLNKYYRKFITRYTTDSDGIKMKTYSIPFTLLPSFSLTEDKIDHRLNGAFPGPSIFDYLKNNNLSYYYDSFTALNLPSNGNDNNRIKMALNAAQNNAYSLFMIYLSLPDSYGHRYGPLSNELMNALYEMDRQIEMSVKMFNKILGECTFIFVGDHGMVTVSETINAKQIIFETSKKLGLKVREDFIYFLDSTLVRLWFYTDKAKKLLTRALNESAQFNKYGKFIDKNISEKYNIPWGDKRYGDMIWWANKGVLVYPDFFHSYGKPCKGMHGYDPEIPESQGMCIVYSDNCKNKIVEKIPLTFTFNILKEELGV